MKRFVCFGLSVILALLVLNDASAQGVPQASTFQGFLRGSSGTPVNNPSQQMRFRIYDTAATGTLIWDSGNLSVQHRVRSDFLRAN